MKYRVIQWGTGFVGKLALRATLEHPDLELVGLVVRSEDKVGRDAGELVLLPEGEERRTSAAAFANGLHGLLEAIGQRADGGEFPIEVAVTSMLVDEVRRDFGVAARAARCQVECSA